jgi:Na+:H+ antiporter, NhaA family
MLQKIKIAPEVYAGLLLLAAAVAALVVVNGGFAVGYEHTLALKIGPALSLGWLEFSLHKSLHHWINDGLMALFFVVVGIEIKRELLHGALRDKKHALLPILGATGGVLAPMVVYMAVVLVSGVQGVSRGWAIPAATDIAFALALATALKNHVPLSMRAFLLALAVLDDLLAIVIIALFYGTSLNVLNLLLGLGGIAVLLAISQRREMRVWPYIVVGFFTWLMVLQSGVHATIAGVALGLIMPLGSKTEAGPAEKLEHTLQPWVMWLVLPLFAFANVGLNLSGLGWNELLAPVTLGIFLGLFVGKQMGVLGAVWLAEKSGFAHRPAGVSWQQVYGVAALCGIGFTMSLFIGNLAFSTPLLQNEVRLGVLLGSTLSALWATAILLATARRV